MDKIQDRYEIVANEKVCPKFCRLAIDARPIADRVRPGQFIHIRVTDGLEPFFRRPFSVYRAQGRIEILYEVVGKGTALLAEKQQGDKLDILGPLGNSFTMPGSAVKQVVMVAGGVGVAPFLILTDALKDKGYELTLLYGGRTRGHIFAMTAFERNGCRVHIASDDGSVGVKGRVTELLAKAPKDSSSTMIYACGPKPMIAAVQAFAREHHIPGEASCEEVMACGLGACLGCAIKTARGYKTVCYDGPVFDLQDIVFDK